MNRLTLKPEVLLLVLDDKEASASAWLLGFVAGGLVVVVDSNLVDGRAATATSLCVAAVVLRLQMLAPPKKFLLKWCVRGRSCVAARQQVETRGSNRDRTWGDRRK